MRRRGYVYIMGNAKPVLYIGVTSNLIKRVWQHKNHNLRGFTDHYNLHKLLYFEDYENIDDAIAREKQLKNWKREWKLDLIQKVNPSFDDLSANWNTDPESSSG